MSARGFFITGTDTDVGKTYCSTLICLQLTKQNKTVIVRKPIESGCELIDGRLVPSDASKLQKASGTAENLDEICPFRFQPAVSPRFAASLAKQTISTEMLFAACQPTKSYDYLLVEGAGGFYSPLCTDGLNADLAVALNLPVILIADDKLGCINHVLLTAEAIKNRGLQLLTVILNKTNTDATGVTLDNANELSAILKEPIFSISNNADASQQKLPTALLQTITGP